MSEPGPDLPRATLVERPPFWGSWGTIYLVVAGLLAAETIAFWLLAKWAS